MQYRTKGHYRYQTSRRSDGRKTDEHRVVTNTEGFNNIVHHKDGNGFNNDPSNLEVMSRSEHMKMHGCKQTTKAKSGFRGVAFDNRGKPKPYFATIKVDQRTINLGSFKTPEEAARVYDQYAKQYFGDRATLNFPDAE